MADEIIRYKEIYDSAESQAKIKYLMELEKQRSVLGGKAFDDKKAQTKAEVKLWDEIVTAQKRAAAGPSEWTKANMALKTEVNLLRESTGQLAGAIGVLSPEMAGLVGIGQKLQGVLSAGAAAGTVAGASLGTVAAVAAPLAVAIGAVGYAWHEHTIEAEAAAAALKKDKEAADDTAKAMASLGDALFEATIRQKEQNGEWTEAQGAAVRASRSLAGQYTPALNEQREALEAAQKAQREAREEATRAADNNAKTAGGFRLEVDLSTKKLAEADAAVKRNQEAYDGLAKKYVEVRDAQTTVIRKDEELKKAKEAGAKATKDATAAQREKEAADAKAAAALQSQHDAIISLTMSIEAAQDPYAKLLQKLDKIAAAEANTAVSAEEATRARTAAVAEWEAAVDKEVEAELAGIEKVKKAKEKAAEDAAEDEKSRRKATINAIIGGASDMTAAIADGAAESYANAEDEIAALQERIDQATEDGDAAKVASLEKQKAFRQKALLKAFDEQKALTLTGISLNTAQAIMAALTAPPPAGQIAAAFATATGAIQFAQAAAEPPPTFEDTPGAVVAPVQNYAPTFKKKDIIIAAQSPTEVQRQAAALGGRPSGRRFVGAEIAENPIARDLRDLNRVTRGRVR